MPGTLTSPSITQETSTTTCSEDATSAEWPLVITGASSVSVQYVIEADGDTFAAVGVNQGTNYTYTIGPVVLTESHRAGGTIDVLVTATNSAGVSAHASTTIQLDNCPPDIPL
jgi:hypothetical protein